MRRLTIRERLASLLEAEGFSVGSDDLRPARGAWRTDVRLDVYRWEGIGQVRERKGLMPGMSVGFASWSTMTSCVRLGIGVGPGDAGIPTDFLIFAKGE